MNISTHDKLPGHPNIPKPVVYVGSPGPVPIGRTMAEPHQVRRMSPETFLLQGCSSIRPLLSRSFEDQVLEREAASQVLLS